LQQSPGQSPHYSKLCRFVHDNIDEVVDIIRSSANDEESANRLKERFAFDDVQTKAVLDMPLKRLNGLEIARLPERWKI
jgi:DNA gyrase subunit A